VKIALASDLHVEFGDIDLVNEQGADLLILAGDICMLKDLDKQSERGDTARNFFLRASRAFSRALYVMGNHEHYSGDFAKGPERFRTFCDAHHITNITLLDKETVEINGYQFIGGTLWTDFNDQDSFTMFNAERSMNDYHSVKNTNDRVSWKFLPKHALSDHGHMRGYLQTCMDNYKESGRTDNRIVVITHHAPSPSSIHPKYANDDLMNGNFYSNMDQFILDNPQIQLWVHGHMHDPFDYGIGGTRVVCNPRGYVQYEQRAKEFEIKYIDLH
jgi:Icc-related predicted phosphoesterase